MSITKSEGLFEQRGKKTPGGFKVATQLLFAICLCSCLPERFRHEKYDCSGSLQTINTIIINKAKVGKYAKIVSPTSETNANITHIDGERAWVTFRNARMEINRKAGTITIVQGTIYRQIVCKKTVFTM